MEKERLKLGTISEAPLLTTGFGICCHHYATELVARGWQVSCFGVAYTGPLDALIRPYHVWLSGRDKRDFLTDIPLFLRQERPDLLLLLGDVWYVQTWVDFLVDFGFPPDRIVAHIVADGLPVSSRYVRCFRKLAAVFVATEKLAEHLAADHGLAVSMVPEGVDLQVFRPLGEARRRVLRTALGLDEVFLVGVFGRNDERKQQPRVLYALGILRERLRRTNIRAYFHCQPTDDPVLNGWDLNEVSEQAGVSDLVIFPERLNQLRGIERVASRDTEDCGSTIDALSYVERLAICDLVVNVPYCGGYEFSTLEAQAVGVPVVLTNDRGNMAEVAGGAAMLLDGTFGVWYNGSHQVFVDPVSIAECIARLQDDDSERACLVEAGLKNAARFGWDIAGQRMSDGLDVVIKGICWAET